MRNELRFGVVVKAKEKIVNWILMEGIPYAFRLRYVKQFLRVFAIIFQQKWKLRIELEIYIIIDHL